MNTNKIVSTTSLIIGVIILSVLIIVVQFRTHKLPASLPEDVTTQRHSGSATSEKPEIKIIIPQNGVNYKIGDQLNIAWRNWNLPKDTLIQAELSTSKYDSCTVGLDLDLSRQIVTETLQGDFCKGKFEGIKTIDGNPYKVIIYAIHSFSDKPGDSGVIAQSDPFIFYVH